MVANYPFLTKLFNPSPKLNQLNPNNPHYSIIIFTYSICRGVIIIDNADTSVTVDTITVFKLYIFDIQTLFSAFGPISKCSVYATNADGTKAFRLFYPDKASAKKAISVPFLNSL